jgi:hypothetical protein
MGAFMLTTNRFRSLTNLTLIIKVVHGLSGTPNIKEYILRRNSRFIRFSWKTI